MHMFACIAQQIGFETYAVYKRALMCSSLDRMCCVNLSYRQAEIHDRVVAQTVKFMDHDNLHDSHHTHQSDAQRDACDRFIDATFQYLSPVAKEHIDFLCAVTYKGKPSDVRISLFYRYGICVTVQDYGLIRSIIKRKDTSSYHKMSFNPKNRSRDWVMFQTSFLPPVPTPHQMDLCLSSKTGGSLVDPVYVPEKSDDTKDVSHEEDLHKYALLTLKGVSPPGLSTSLGPQGPSL